MPFGLDCGNLGEGEEEDERQGRLPRRPPFTRQVRIRIEGVGNGGAGRARKDHYRA